MAKTKISEYSATAANNTDINGIDIAEGCAPSGINNAIRELMAQLKDQQAGTDGDNLSVGGNLTVTGTTTATGAMAVTGAITATGGVTGNVVGNLTGNVTGNATGNLISVTNTVTSGSFIVGNTYVIATTGTTDFTLIGASANTVGIQFTATGVGTGTGTATTVTGRAANVTGVVGIANGGTGVTSFTQNALIVGNGTSSPTSILPSTNGNVLSSTAGATVTAGSFVVGTQYTILTVGTTSFTAIGASANTVGVVFTATGVGSGDGTATTNTWASSSGYLTSTNFTGSNQSLTTTGYQKLVGGLIIQWGTIPVLTDNTSTTITFSIPFPTAVFSFVVTNSTSSTGVDAALSYRSLTTSTVTVAQMFGTTTGGSYIAIGY
jgi:hypothetical protein